MDYSIVVMEESRQKSDSAVSALGSLVQIDSIAIDISTSAVEEIESPTHEHFSIRGFVAGMRKRDRKTCLPFASEGNDAELVDNLPPLVVPRFQWWQCSNCIPDATTKRSVEGKVLACRNNVGTSSSQNVGEKNAFLSHTNESIDDEDNYPSKTIKYSNSCCNEGHKATTCGKDKANVMDKEAANPCAIPEPNPFKMRERLNNISVRPSCTVDEPESASSGSDAIFSALPRRRKPKLRFLADIMVDERNSTSDNPRTISASSGEIQVSSPEKEAVLGPEFEVDIHADAAKLTRSPQSKRKTTLEEERGPLGVNNPSAMAKRTRSLMLHAERKCRRVQNSDSESDRDAPIRPDMQLGAKAQRTKPKANKALDISKKVKQIHNEDRTVSVTELPKIDAICSVNLQKHPVSEGASFGKFGDAPSTMGERGSYFRSFPSGQQIERISNLSKGKIAEAEANHDPLMPTNKSILGNCNTNRNVALDLSLNSFMDAEINSNSQPSFAQYRGIPDLNEEFPQKTAMMQGKHLNNHSEKRSLPLQKTLDDFPSCTKETTREGRQLQNKDNSKEVGASDDIPMDIVELLARKQHERTLGNSRKGINKGYPALYVDGRPGMINFPLANRSGLTVGNGNAGVRQNIAVNLTQLNNCRVDMNKPEESQFELFSSSTPNQQMKTHYSAMTGPRPSTGAELFWSPTRENVPFHLSVPQKHSIQPNRMIVRPYSDQCHKGKTTSDLKVGKGKKVVHDAAMFKEGRIASSSTSVRSLDPYSNDTIPALQLLSLMDQQIVSGSSFEVGPKRFIDKLFSPCNHHQRLNGKVNQNFPGGSFFSQNSHCKDLSGLRYDVYRPGEISKRAPSHVLDQRPSAVGNSKVTPLNSYNNHMIRNPELGACTLNRNPADFSIPDARNEFTLTAKDFKFRKKKATKEKPHLVNVEGAKRRRITKDASGKECSRK